MVAGVCLFDPLEDVQMKTTATDRPVWISFPEIQKLTGVDRKTLERMIDRGVFPKPLPVSMSKRFWNRAAVEAVLNGQLPRPESA